MSSDLSWKPSASIALLRQRALFMAAIRQFFTSRDFLEVETTGHISSKGRQVASVFFGEAIAVSSYLEHYRENKHSAISDLKVSIHDQLQLALDNSQSANDSLQSRSQTCP